VLVFPDSWTPQHLNVNALCSSKTLRNANPTVSQSRRSKSSAWGQFIDMWWEGHVACLISVVKIYLDLMSLVPAQC
jgi:hypothetical protein